MGSLSPSGTVIPQLDIRHSHRDTDIKVTSVINPALDETVASLPLSVEREKFTADASSSGNLLHHVTRKISGIHVSVSKREAILQQNKTAIQIASGVLGSNAIGPMETITERKAFFLDSDRDKTSGLAAWTIFSASGVPVGEAEGTTDTDITPNATFDQ
jgi:hypothetical protein